MPKAGKKILLVDLNNFARYPTIPIGYLAAILRKAGFAVAVFSPLSIGVAGVVREPKAKPWSLLDQRARYWSATSRNWLVKNVREFSRQRFALPMLSRQSSQVTAQFESVLEQNHFDAVLVSTYLMYFDTCHAIGELCDKKSIPLLIGGPYFAQPEVRKEWCKIPGLSALVGGEVELELPGILNKILEGRSILNVQGMWTSGCWKGPERQPFEALDELPFPDYTDFPWSKYPERIVPLITGRGCGWGACNFCSDITSTAGRTYRSRSPQNVFEEIGYQQEKHQAKLFVFTDLKLNSDLDVWSGLVENFQSIVPEGRWVASVHVDSHQENGLSRGYLQNAARAGMVRVTTGLESGSQRVLDSMKKGTRLEMTSEFLRNAAAAGISVRVTMIVGYPGEEADDVQQTADFLNQHTDCIERVLVNRFQIMTGTNFHRLMNRYSHRYSTVRSVSFNHKLAQVGHELDITRTRLYRRQILEVLRAAHRINRRPLRPIAQAFEGVM